MLTDEGIIPSVRAEALIANTQDNNLNNLKNYTNNKADYETKLISTRKNKQTFIEGNMPEVLKRVEGSSKKTILKYGIFGCAAGFVISVAVILLSMILGSTIRNAETLETAVLGVCKRGKCIPELAKTCLDIEMLSRGQKPFLLMIEDDDITKEVTRKYCELLSCASGHWDKAEDLRNMIDCGCAVIVAEAGKTTHKRLEETVRLCDRYSVKYIGCVVIE